MIEVKQANEFDTLMPILDVFFQENDLTEEKIIERMEFYKGHFNEEDIIYFIVTIDDESKGFMSFIITEKIIQTHRFFVKKCEEYDDLVFELISETSKQLEPLKKDYFQVFFVNSLNLKQKFVERNFDVFTRVKMVYNLKENQIPELILNPDYQLKYFTLDKLDEELQIIVDANINALDGSIFRQFSDLDTLKKFFYRSNMDSDRLRSDSPIIVKNDKIVGVNIVVNMSETASYIWIVALLPEHRGKGLGKYLMLKSHEECKKANVDQMVLDVTVDNVVAHSLYNKLGYKETMRYLTVLKKY